MHVYKRKSTVLFWRWGFLERGKRQDYPSTWGDWQNYHSSGSQDRAPAIEIKGLPPAQAAKLWSQTGKIMVKVTPLAEEMAIGSGSSLHEMGPPTSENDSESIEKTPRATAAV